MGKTIHGLIEKLTKHNLIDICKTPTVKILCFQSTYGLDEKSIFGHDIENAFNMLRGKPANMLYRICMFACFGKGVDH